MAYGRYRLKGFDYRANRWYFVTAVTARRQNIFGEIEGTELAPSSLGVIVNEEIAALPSRRPEIQLAIATVLPNHVHFLIGLRHEFRETENLSKFGPLPAASLSAIVGGLKAGVARRARNELRWGSEDVWQRRFYDRVVRNQEEWNAIADYILWNPVNWHLDPLSGAREPTEEEVRDWKRRLGM